MGIALRRSWCIAVANLHDYPRRGKSPREAEVEAKKQELLAVIKTSGLKATPGQTTHVWQYYPPFAPNWLRLNEVLLPVDDA